MSGVIWGIHLLLRTAQHLDRLFKRAPLGLWEALRHWCWKAPCPYLPLNETRSRNRVQIQAQSSGTHSLWSQTPFMALICCICRTLLQQLQKLQTLVMGKVSRTCKLAGTQTGTCLMVSFPKRRHPECPSPPHLQCLPTLPSPGAVGGTVQLAQRQLLCCDVTMGGLMVHSGGRMKGSLSAWTFQVVRGSRLALWTLEVTGHVFSPPHRRWSCCALLLHLAASFRATGPIRLLPRWLCPASVPRRSRIQPLSVRQCSAACKGSCFLSLELFESSTFQRESYEKV